MWKKAVYAAFLSSSLAGLAWWSICLNESSGNLPEFLNKFVDTYHIRQQVLEYLDQVVQAEHAYFSRHGSFTSQLDSLSVPRPKEIDDLYHFRILENSLNHLKIIAFSNERRTLASDVVSVNQD